MLNKKLLKLKEFENSEHVFCPFDLAPTLCVATIQIMNLEINVEFLIMAKEDNVEF